MVILNAYPKYTFNDPTTNAPLVGGKVWTYLANSDTLLTTYQDPDGQVENSNPIILDSAGQCEIWWPDVNYKIKVYTADDVLIQTIPKITSPLSILAESDGSDLIGFEQSDANSQLMTVQDKLRQTIYVNDFIPPGTNTQTTDCTTYIQNAIDSLPDANVFPCLWFEGGKRYLISSNGDYALLFDRPMTIHGNGAFLIYNGEDRGIKITSGNLNVYDLHLKNTTYSTSSPISDLQGSGWAFKQGQDSRFYNCTAEGFTYGFAFVAEGAGVSSIDLYSCISINNQYNVFMDTANVSGSYTTNINWYGGRVGVLSSFSNYTGSRGILVQKSYSYAVDGIHFKSTLVEGNAERKLECGVLDCSFDDLYYDVQGPVATTDIVISSSAESTRIMGGDDLRQQVISDSGKYTLILDGNGMKIGGGIDFSTAAVGSTAGQIKFPSTQNPSSDPHTIDDYFEQGSWSPTLDQLNNITGTPTISGGKYTKVGRLVTLDGIISATITSSNTLTIIRMNLPYQHQNAEDGACGTAVVKSSGVTGHTCDFSDGTSGFMMVRFPAVASISSGAVTIDFSYTYQASVGS